MEAIVYGLDLAEDAPLDKERLAGLWFTTGVRGARTRQPCAPSEEEPARRRRAGCPGAGRRLAQLGAGCAQEWRPAGAPLRPSAGGGFGRPDARIWRWPSAAS